MKRALILVLVLQSFAVSIHVPFIDNCVVEDGINVHCQADSVSVTGQESDSIQETCCNSPEWIADCPRYLRAVVAAQGDLLNNLDALGEVLDAFTGTINVSTSYWSTIKSAISATAIVASGRANIAVFGQRTEYYVAALLFHLPRILVTVYASCESASPRLEEHGPLQFLLFLFGHHRLHVLCHGDLDSVPSFDSIIITGRPDMSYERTLNLIQSGTAVAKAGSVVVVDSCEPDFTETLPDDEYYPSTMAWRHAREFNLVQPILGISTAPTCLGHFSPRATPIDESVQLSFSSPLHNDVFFEDADVAVSLHLRLGDGPAADAVRTSLHSWQVCAGAKFHDLTGKVTELSSPTCIDLTEMVYEQKGMPRIPLDPHAHVTESKLTQRKWLLSCWLQADATPSIPGDLRILGLQSINIETHAPFLARAQVWRQRMKLSSLLNPTSPTTFNGIDIRSPVERTEWVPPLKPSRDMLRKWAFVASWSRGTGFSTFLYAKYLYEMMRPHLQPGSPLLVCLPPRDPEFVAATAELFGESSVVFLDGWPSPQVLDPILREHNVTDVYMQKRGENDGLVSRLEGVRTCVHTVFYAHEPHGTVYAKISDSLHSRPDIPTVPIVIGDAINDGPDLRSELNIPEDATVFGRYGGYDQFDLQFVMETVHTLSSRHLDIYFLFMNTPVFCCEGSKNVLFLPGTGSVARRAKFALSCDAMLHARAAGETFGMAVGEFSVLNRPVLTFAGSQDQNHISILNDRALLYHDEESLTEIIVGFNRTRAKMANWNMYRHFCKGPAMRRFIEVFWGKDGA